MEFDFETLVERSGANLKLMMTPPEVVKAGNISLDGAEPDFKSAPVIEEAVIRFAKNGLYGFTLPDEAYKSAVTKWMQMSRKTQIKPEWIVTTLGTIYSLATTIRLVCTDPDDGIIVTTPVYNRYRQAADRLNKKTVECPLLYDSVNGSYQMNFDAIKSAMANPNNKLFVLCNPHNPVGRVWTKEELETIGDICYRHHVIVVSDEIHADFAFQGKHQVFANLKKEYEEMTIACTSPSKTFNLAGLQTSNIFIPNQKLKNAFKKQLAAAGYSQLNAAGLVACEAAYRDGEEWYQAMKKYVAGNIAFTKEFVEKNLPGVNMVEHEGTYLIWLDFNGLGLCAQELEDLIVHKAKLWLDSGRIFGKCGRGFQRINVACPRSTLKEALERIAKVLPADTVKFAS